MSSISDIDLDLEKLFQPAWAQEKPATNRFDRFTGNEGVKPERRFNDKPGERRAPRRDNAGGGERPRSGGKFGGKKAFGRRDDNRGDRFNDSTFNVQRKAARRCRKFPSRLCPAKTASNRSRARSR